MTWREWLKALREELGRAQGRKKITQAELAAKLGLRGDDASKVGKWEMKKDSPNRREPDRDNYIKLVALASAALGAQVPRSSEAGIKPQGPVSGPLDSIAPVPLDRSLHGGEMSALELAMQMVESLSMDAQMVILEAIGKRARGALAHPPAAMRAK